MARIEVTATNFPGAALQGSGADTLVLVGGGTFDFAYVTLSRFSEIVVESGANKFATVRISGEQLAGVSSFRNSDATTTFDNMSLYLTGQDIDLSNKAFEGLRHIYLDEDDATVTVTSLPLALKITAFERQGETIILNGPVSTPTSRADLHNRGFDTIIEGSNTWTDASPVVTGLGGHFYVQEGESVHLDPDGNANISDAEGRISSLDIVLSGSGYFFPMSHFKYSPDFRILDNSFDQSLMYKGSLIGSIGRTAYGDGASITFNQSATAEMINEFVRSLSYTPGDFVHYENISITITARDKGLRKAEAVLYVTAENNWTPTKPTLRGSSVAENSAAGTVVGTLNSTDANGDPITYRLTDNAGGRFRIDNDKLVVSGNTPIDYEQATQHTVTIVANDGEQDGLAATFTISVLNVVESTDPTPTVPTPTTQNRTVGTKGKDVLVGTDKTDFLYGGLGNDKLTGGQGNDVFVFNAKLGTAKTDRKVNFDTITDFTITADSIWLDDKIFNNKALKLLGKKASETNPKKLTKKFFTVGDKAKDKDDYIVYNKKTGVLSYDSDGSGSKAAIEFAQLKKGLSLKADHFFIV